MRFHHMVLHTFTNSTSSFSELLEGKREDKEGEVYRDPLDFALLDNIFDLL
uniref:Uncharacterized protein n=1 Tax=Lepeophtheirus salmonis TaxID=72036 RepID=A0A0K2VIL0_LEPSM